MKRRSDEGESSKKAMPMPYRKLKVEKRLDPLRIAVASHHTDEPPSSIAMPVRTFNHQHPPQLRLCSNDEDYSTHKRQGKSGGGKPPPKEKPLQVVNHRLGSWLQAYCAIPNNVKPIDIVPFNGYRDQAHSFKVRGIDPSKAGLKTEYGLSSDKIVDMTKHPKRKGWSYSDPPLWRQDNPIEGWHGRRCPTARELIVHSLRISERLGDYKVDSETAEYLKSHIGYGYLHHPSLRPERRACMSEKEIKGLKGSKEECTKVLSEYPNDDFLMIDEDYVCSVLGGSYFKGSSENDFDKPSEEKSPILAIKRGQPLSSLDAETLRYRRWWHRVMHKPLKRALWFIPPDSPKHSKDAKDEMKYLVKSHSPIFRNEKGRLDRWFLNKAGLESEGVWNPSEYGEVSVETNDMKGEWWSTAIHRRLSYGYQSKLPEGTILVQSKGDVAWNRHVMAWNRYHYGHISEQEFKQELARICAYPPDNANVLRRRMSRIDRELAVELTLCDRREKNKAASDKLSEGLKDDSNKSSMVIEVVTDQAIARHIAKRVGEERKKLKNLRDEVVFQKLEDDEVEPHHLILRRGWSQLTSGLFVPEDIRPDEIRDSQIVRNIFQ